MREKSVEQQLQDLERAGTLGPAPDRDHAVPPPLDVDGNILQAYLQEDRENGP